MRVAPLLFLVVACGGSPPPPVPTPPPEPPPDIEETAEEPEVDTLPPDPLAGLDRAGRWQWAVTALPALAELDRPVSLDIDALEPDDGRVILYSPDLGDHADGLFQHRPCTPLQLVVRNDRLVTRLPIGAGRARPDLPGDHVVLALGPVVEIGPLVTDGRLRMPTFDRAADAPPVAELTAAGPDALRYEGRLADWGVACAERITERRCADGGASECRACEPALVAAPGGAAGGARSLEVDSPCGPCPSDAAARALLDPLSRVIDEQRFVDVAPEHGPVFFTARRACQAERRQPPPSPPE